MTFAHRPSFYTTFAAVFETTSGGGLHIAIDGDGTSESTNLTKKEAQELRDFLIRHIPDDGTARATSIG